MNIQTVNNNSYKSLLKLQNSAIRDIYYDYDELFMSLYTIVANAKAKAEIRKQLQKEQELEVRSISKLFNIEADRLNTTLIKNICTATLPEEEIDQHFVQARNAIEAALPKGAKIGSTSGHFSKLTSRGRVQTVLFELLNYEIVAKRRKLQKSQKEVASAV